MKGPSAALARHYLRVSSRLREEAAREWSIGRPALILVLVFAALVLLDGLLTIGILQALDAIGLAEPSRPESVGAEG
jgi:hypothetical protein